MTPFDLSGEVAVVTGASGVLGKPMVAALAASGARVAMLARDPGRLAAAASEVGAVGVLAVPADVQRDADLAAARDRVVEVFGPPTILVNAAGGNIPEATIEEGASVFDLEIPALEHVVDLNLLGTMRAILTFAPAMAARRRGSIVNISSATADRAVSRVLGYSAAKAAIENLTRWLAVELARRHGQGIRVNAIAPGFFVGEQNRALLMQPDGQPTARGRRILELTPAGRFGAPEELVSTLLWLCSPGSSFVTGVVVPVDGGFRASSGV